MAPPPIRIDGVDDLKAVFAELPKATQKAVLRRVLMRPAKRIVTLARGNAPVRLGGLRRSIAAVASSDAAAAGKRAFAEAMSGGGSRGEAQSAARAASAAAGGTLTVIVHAGRHPKAHLTEFGSIHNTPVGWMRKAMDAVFPTAVAEMSADLWTEIRATAMRRAKRLAK
jgi:hypothetical protein